MMPDEVAELIAEARRIIIDTGCSWPDACAKTLKGRRLRDESRDWLILQGLIRSTRDLNTGRRQPEAISYKERANTVLEPLSQYYALIRVFRIGDMNMRFIDCTTDDLHLLNDTFRKKAEGHLASARFTEDVAAECQRVGAATVADLPVEVLTRLDKKAPWVNG